jgi:hypothetical protein
MLAVIPSVAAAGLLGLAIARWMGRRGASHLARTATVAFSMVNPLALEALALGHPEELLGGALCAGAVLAALRGHSVRAGILLGLAIATALTLPWTSAAHLLHPLTVALAVPLSAAWWFSRSRTPDDALALLALLFLLPCLLDPLGSAYQYVPFLLALTAWEGLTRRGLPLVTMLCSVAIYCVFLNAGWAQDMAMQSALYLGATLPVALWLAIRLYVPRRAMIRAGSRRPLAAPGTA